MGGREKFEDPGCILLFLFYASFLQMAPKKFCTTLTSVSNLKIVLESIANTPTNLPYQALKQAAVAPMQLIYC